MLGKKIFCNLCLNLLLTSNFSNWALSCWNNFFYSSKSKRMFSIN